MSLTVFVVILFIDNVFNNLFLIGRVSLNNDTLYVNVIFNYGLFAVKSSLLGILEMHIRKCSYKIWNNNGNEILYGWKYDQ